MQKEIKIGIGAVYIVALVFVLIFVGKPQMIQIKKLLIQKNFLENEMNYMNLEAEKFEKNEKKEEMLKKELKKLNAVLLSSIDSIALYQKFVKEYKKSNTIDLLLFEPAKQEKRKANPSQGTNAQHNAGRKNKEEEGGIVPIKLSFRSRYKALVDYLAYIESIDFISSVHEVTMKSSTVKPALLDVSMTINLYTQNTNASSEKSRIYPNAADSKRKPVLSNVTFISPTSINKAKKEKEIKVDFSVSGIVGNDTIIVGDGVYTIGESVKGWKILKVDQPGRKVTVQKGKQTTVLLSR